MWRTPHRRRASAADRLRLAAALWQWHPHAKQKLFFMSPAQVRVAACGRRWGKTEALAVDIATLALDEAAHGRDCRQLVVAPTDAQARLIGGQTLTRLQDAQGSPSWPPGLTLAVRQRPALQITLRPPDAPKDAPLNVPEGASQITFRTAGRDGRGLRGLWAHRIVCDEAAYVPDAVLSEVLLPMLTDVGGEFVLASTPAGRRNVFHRMFARGGTPAPAPPRKGAGGREEITYQSFQCPSTDNRHINGAFLRAMQEELGESRFAQEYLSRFVDDYGAVFPADDIDGCLRDDDRVALDGGDLVSAPAPGRWYTVGVDWGRRRDFTVVCVLDAGERPARLVGLWRMRGTGWEAQAARVGALVARFAPLRVLADGSGVGDPVAERLQAEIRARTPDGEYVPQVERFLFAGESKGALVDRLALGLSARALTYPSHPALLRELRGFEYRGETQSGRPRMAAAGAGHDDIVMALALAWQAAPDGPPPAPSSLILLGSSLGVGRGDPSPDPPP